MYSWNARRKLVNLVEKFQKINVQLRTRAYVDKRKNASKV